MTNRQKLSQSAIQMTQRSDRGLVPRFTKPVNQSSVRFQSSFPMDILYGITFQQHLCGQGSNFPGDGLLCLLHALVFARSGAKKLLNFSRKISKPDSTKPWISALLGARTLWVSTDGTRSGSHAACSRTRAEHVHKHENTRSHKPCHPAANKNKL